MYIYIYKCVLSGWFIGRTKKDRKSGIRYLLDLSLLSHSSDTEYFVPSNKKYENHHQPPFISNIILTN